MRFKLRITKGELKVILPWMSLFSFILLGTIFYPREEVIGSFITSLEGRTDNQIHNLKLSAKAIDGLILKPGQIFSFNDVAGPWSRDKGYRKAYVSYTGLLFPALGGGVCQVSSTLYNAVLLAGLEVLERGPHYWCPNYVAPGRDSAVAYGQLDLKFRNNLPKPIRIKARIWGNKFIVEILSRYKPSFSVEIISERKKIKSPRYILTEKREIFPKAREGYKVELYRVFFKDGEEIQREFLSSDEYPPLPIVIKR